MRDETLLALGDLGLGEPRLAEVDARCRAALEREQRPGRRRLRFALPLAACLTVAVGAVGYAALSSPETLSNGIECHANGQLDGGGAIVAVDGRPATQTCAGLSPAAAPLHACVDPAGGGAIHVLPGDGGVCARAGLTESPTAGADAEARQYARFEQPLLARLNQVDCPSAALLRQMVQTSLHGAQLTGWTIRDEGGYSAALPCASLALDSDRRVATLSPIGR